MLCISSDGLLQYVLNAEPTSTMKLRPKSLRSSCIKSPLSMYRFSIVCETKRRGAGSTMTINDSDLNRLDRILRIGKKK